MQGFPAACFTSRRTIGRPSLSDTPPRNARGSTAQNDRRKIADSTRAILGAALDDIDRAFAPLSKRTDRVYQRGSRSELDLSDLVGLTGTTMDVKEPRHVNPGAEDAGSERSEYHFETIIDAIPVLAWCARVDGSAEFLNQRWRDYTGMSLDDALGWGWTVALHPEDFERVTDQWRIIVAAAKPAELEARLRRWDGEYRWFLFRAAPALDDRGAVVAWYGTTTDIEDRKRAEEILRATEQGLRLIVDSIPGFVCTMSARGDVEFVNRQILDYMGVTLDELKEWSSALPEEDRARVIDAWNRSIETGCPYDIEHRIRRADGVYRWFHVRGLPLRDPQGSIVRWYMLLADIEERKRAEMALGASERELRLILDTLPAMISVASAEGIHEYSNQRVTDFLGKELGNVGYRYSIHPDDLAAVASAWLDCTNTGEAMDVTYRLRRSDSVYRWINSRLAPLLDERGNIVRWYALLVDVDDQKHAEDALRASQAELAHVTRVMAMGELTASIAHEVNQPLAAVTNNASACLGLLPDDDPNLDEVRNALADIVDDADRASRIISRVRQLATRAPFEPAILNLGDIVTDVVALTRHEFATRRVTICTDLSEQLPLVLGDRVQLQQVLLNLVVNGMDAMRTVEESKRVLTIRARHGAEAAIPQAVLSVQDAGIGLAADEMDRLFEAFYTTKADGMGMGLAISRSIIAAHRGRLWAEPNCGPGATFVFSLPAAGAAAG